METPPRQTGIAEERVTDPNIRRSLEPSIDNEGHKIKSPEELALEIGDYPEGIIDPPVDMIG